MQHLPTEARDLFADGSALEGAEIISASISEGGVLHLAINGGFPAGIFALEISATTEPEPWGSMFSTIGVLKVDYDEPPGAGADPYGRPDPATHPEAWTE